jgi:hypothetical protein
MEQRRGDVSLKPGGVRAARRTETVPLVVDFCLRDFCSSSPTLLLLIPICLDMGLTLFVLIRPAA